MLGNRLYQILSPVKHEKHEQGRAKADGADPRAMEERDMPKLKTHRGAAKRFKKTASGKFKRAKAFKSHILTKKAPGRKRGLAQGDDRRPKSRHRDPRCPRRCCRTPDP